MHFKQPVQESKSTATRVPWIPECACFEIHTVCPLCVPLRAHVVWKDLSIGTETTF